MHAPKTYPKHVAVLEGFWSEDAERPLSIAPIFELLSRRDGLRYVMLTSGTVEELRFNLAVTRTVRGGVLVLAFHGFKGGIHLVTEDVTLEDLASWLEGFGKKKKWIVLFHSCGTLNVEEERIENFMANTGVRAVFGFKKNVDFVDSVAVDLLLIDWLHFYRSVPRFWSRFRKVYKDLVEVTGLTVFFNGHRAKRT